MTNGLGPESGAARVVRLQNGNIVEVTDKGYDPESLLTGAEIAAGLNYTDFRVWPTYGHYLDAVDGLITPDEIAEIAPRRRQKALPIPEVDTRVRLGRIN